MLSLMNFDQMGGEPTFAAHRMNDQEAQFAAGRKQPSP